MWNIIFTFYYTRVRPECDFSIRGRIHSKEPNIHYIHLKEPYTKEPCIPYTKEPYIPYTKEPYIHARETSVRKISFWRETSEERRQKRDICSKNISTVQKERLLCRTEWERGKKKSKKTYSHTCTYAHTYTHTPEIQEWDMRLPFRRGILEGDKKDNKTTHLSDTHHTQPHTRTHMCRHTRHTITHSRTPGIQRQGRAAGYFCDE